MYTSKILCRILLFFMSVLIVVTQSVVLHSAQDATPKEKKLIVDDKPIITEPRLVCLLTARIDEHFDPSSDFFCTLAALNTENNFNVEWCNFGQAVALKSGKRSYVVALLNQPAFSVPGTEIRKLILFGDDGKFLDSVICTVGSRYGTLRTVQTNPDKSDGAQFIVRFISRFEASKWHHSHTILHGENSYTFDVAEKNEPIDWINRGLVRLAIKNGRFWIQFPVVNEDGDKDPDQ